MMIRQVRALVMAGALTSVGGPLSAQTLPISFGQEQLVGRAERIGSIMAAQVAPDGSVYVVDDAAARILSYDAEGRHRWTVGRRGRGPGEFRIPYRIAVRRDGSVFIFDMGTSEVTVLSSAGTFVDRYRLPFPLMQVDNLVALDDELLIAGTTADPTGSGKGIHRFHIERPVLRYAGSFGLLPVARDPMVLQMWGAGAIVPGSTGSIWYTRRLPYEVYRFDMSGRQRAVIRPPFRARGTPDDAIAIERSRRNTTFTNTDVIVEVPGPAWELPGGLLLVSRISREQRVWDVFSIAGRYRGAFPLPQHWESIAGYDHQRRVLWVTGTLDGSPVLYRVPVVITPTRQRD